MSGFYITLIAVAVMLGYAVPGYLLVKSKKIHKDNIQSFATILMYVCAPCLNIYTIINTPFSKQIVIDAGCVFVVSVLVQVGFLLIFKFIFRKKYDDVKYRVCTIATAMGNCGFMGVPLLEAIMPDHPEAVLMSTVFCVGMSLIGWTLASYIISNDKSFMSIKYALLNPSMLSLVFAIPVFLTGIEIPSQINAMITLFGKMSAPMCMLIMGMRLATMDLKSVFTDKMVYGIVAIKQFAMPFIVYFIMILLPVDSYLVKCMFVLSATPIASMVLNYAELIGQGQKRAANLVLVGTICSIITLPLMMLIVYG